MLEDILRGLWATRINVPPDLIQSLRGTETHTRNDYLGRAVFEFFQNAVDRAERRIDIALTTLPEGQAHRLAIANDGEPVSIRGLDEAVSIRFPLVSGDLAELTSRYGANLRSDFQALCNIHNSSKQAGQSIGNKGVGFKSAWEFARSVLVASTLADGQRYAFRFHQTLKAEQVRDRTAFWPGLDQGLREAAAAVLAQTQGLPSFYFPEHVVEANACFAGREWATTVIFLEGVDEEGRARLEDRINEFRKAPLFFINQLRSQDGQKRPRDIEVATHCGKQLQLLSTRLPEGWRVVDESLLSDLWPEQVPALHEAARKLNFSIEHPSLAIAFPPLRVAPEEFRAEGERPNRFFCYLPTYVDCGFGIQIHADFMLDMSRKHIEVKQNPYNQKLLHLAGRLLGRTLRTQTDLHGRADVMGFLLPGNANNPAVEELRRGLALELHLPVEGETADPATFRDFLAAIFPSTQTIWPEIRYEQTLNFLRAWCAPIAYERGNKYRERTAPFINLLREQQTPILPEQVNNGLVTAALPLPEVDAEGRLRDGRGIFWRRKQSRDTGEVVGSDFSLGETGIVGLAVTEWDPLTDTDKTLLGLLDFNLGEIAHRLRIYVENACAGQTIVQAEKLSFDPAAVLRFVAALLRRSDQIALERIHALGFLSSGGSADNLSKMLLPVAGGGWRVGREVMLPDAAPELQMLLADEHGPVSLLDLPRFQACCGIVEVGQTRQMALALGVWPCLALRQAVDAWELPFGLARLGTAALREAFYRTFVAAWAHWFAASPIFAEQVAQTLRCSNVPWLPLEADYNTPENRQSRPMEVLLVNERDRTRQSFLLKKTATTESELIALRAIGVVVATEAGIDKLLAVLAFMGRSTPGDEALRGRYRTLVLELARREWTMPVDAAREQLKGLPVLVSQANALHWASSEQAREAWFVPRQFQRLRTVFRDECTFLDLDADTAAPWIRQALGARWFEPKLEMGSGDPVLPEGESPPPCLETRQRLQDTHLADLMLIAESASMGGAMRNREAIVAEWRRLVFRHGERVWVKVSLDGKHRFVGADLDRFDVLLDDSEGRLEIWHDVPLIEIDDYWYLFAEPLAMGVFGNRLLADAFAAYLGAGERQVAWLADRYGVTDNERAAMQSYLSREFLGGVTLNALLEVLIALPEWRGHTLDPEELRLRWWDAMFYIDNRLALDADGLCNRLPNDLADRFPYLDPTPINTRRWEQSFDESELYKAVLTNCLEHGETYPETAAALAMGELLADPEALSRFDFDPRDEQIRRIARLFGESTDYSDWCATQCELLGWLSAERVLSGEIADVAILTAAPSSAAEINIATLTQAATRRVVKTSQAAREQESRDHHLAGMTAEHRVVMDSARNLLDSPDRNGRWAEVRALWQAVRAEFDSLPDLPVEFPQLPKDLTDALHVAVTIGDGLGFDAIEVGTQSGQVWLAEVKSATGGRLFLSENERLKALRFAETAPGRWRLKVWLGDGKWTDDQITRSVIDTFRDIEVRLAGTRNVRPEGWVFQLGQT